MAVEYIKREIKTEKIQLPDDFDSMQVSINDWGHLTIRFFSCKNQNVDVVISFSVRATDRILQFIRNICVIILIVVKV